MLRSYFGRSFWRIFVALFLVTICLQIFWCLYLKLAYGIDPIAPWGGVPGTTFWINLTIAYCLFAAVQTLFVARILTRPFQLIARGATKIAANIDADPLPEIGPFEARQAARLCNMMQEAIQRQLAERNRFLAAVSHDLRTPLTRMKLRIGADRDESQMERMSADIEELIQLVDGTLSYIRNREAHEKFSRVDIAALVDAIAEDAVDAGEQVSVKGNAEPIQAQYLALKRCMTNVVNNALRYGGSAHITMFDSSSQLTIEIVDNGPGIPESELSRVLEPFCRVESSRNVDTGGTGLGLTIASDVVKMHGGTLALYNRQPHGLVVKIMLPRD
jgi:signal transduction histidine kinase